jgi:hypothetical protein
MQWVNNFIRLNMKFIGARLDKDLGYISRLENNSIDIKIKDAGGLFWVETRPNWQRKSDGASGYTRLVDWHDVALVSGGRNQTNLCI